MPGALHSIRVLEIASNIAGPYAAMLLAEQGADVVKVEPPGGDPGRRLPGSPVWNRSKRSCTADLASPADAAFVRRLALAADAVICDLPPAHASALALDYQSLAADAPALVYCRLTPFGTAGPHAGRPPVGDLAAALGGLLAGQPSASQEPIYLTLPFAEYGAAFLAAQAIAAALYVRERTGRGQQADVSLLAGALAMQTGSIVLSDRFPVRNAGVRRDPQGTLPAYRLFRAADDWLFLALGNATFFNKFCLAIERPDLVSDPRFENAPWGIHPQENRDAFTSLVGGILAQRPREEWLRLFDEYDVPAAPVEDRRHWIDSDVVRANAMRVELHDPAAGPTVQPGLPLDLERTPGAIRGPAPLPGAHTEELRRESVTLTPKPPPAGRTPVPRRALEGLRVVDFSAYIAGPLCPMMLADLGADVVKVEPPAGEPFRVLGLAFLGWNRGKRAIALDLHQPAAREAAYELVRRADVLVENFRPGVAERLGLDYATTRTLNPRIIHCTTTGWGAYTPWAPKPAFDPLLQARSGACKAQGGDGPPVFFAVALSDYTAAFLSVYGILAALYERERSGLGQRVSTALVKSTMAVQTGEFVFYAGRPEDRRGGIDPPGVSAAYRLYRGSDGCWLFVAARTTTEWSALAQAVGVGADVSPAEALTADREGPLAQALAERFATRPAADWLAVLDRAGVPCAPVLSPLDQVESPQALANDLIAEHDHEVWGHLTQTGQLIKLSLTPGVLQRPAPNLGEHTRDVLRELGYDDARIEALLASGAAVGT